MRGHGHTETVGDRATLTFSAYAADVAFVIEQFAQMMPVRHVSLVGMSMGAEIALHLAADRPELVDSLVVVRPARPLGVGAISMVPVYERLHQCLSTRGVDGKAAFAASPEFTAIQAESPVTAQSLLRQFDRPEAALRCAVIGAFAAQDGLASEYLARIEVPALVMVVPQDPAHPAECGEFLAGTLPHAEPLVVLPAKDSDGAAYEIELRRNSADFLRRVITATYVKPRRDLPPHQRATDLIESERG
jgi:pimeloyl-ACP methyl ester carboxylesterase